MRRRYRKYRSRRSYRSRRRYSRRYRSFRQKKEMKIYTYLNQAVTVQAINQAASTTAPGSMNLLPDILSNITVGTGPDQRIGTEIFVKKIQFIFTPALCPVGFNAQLTGGIIRYIVSSASFNITAGTGVQNFFDSPTNVCVDGPLNRRYYVVHKDRVFTMNAGFPAATLNTGTFLIGTGAIWRHNLSFNLNRKVKFLPGGTKVSSEQDSICLFAVGMTPGLAAGSNAQLACMSYRVRVWYTDS